MTRRPDISDSELKRRVAYSLLRPAVAIARRFDIGLKELKEWLELAYYHQLKEQGLTLDEAADAAGVSRRKVAQLSKKLKLSFFQPEQDAELPRRIEFMLWAGEMTEGRILQAFRELPEENVRAALRTLVEEGRVDVDEGRTPTYRVPKSEFRLFENNWVARIDGLNNQLGKVANMVVGRFFRADPRAFQRTLDFRIRPDDLADLRAFYQEVIFPRLAEFDEAAKDEENVSIGLSIGWAPNYEDEESR